MKITRDGNKITLEVEASDCRPGETPEVVADFMYSGMVYGYQHPQLMNGAVKKALDEASDIAELQVITQDLKEKWEILP